MQFQDLFLLLNHVEETDNSVNQMMSPGEGVKEDRIVPVHYN